MSIPSANINVSTDTFSVWVTRTNQLLSALTNNIVTVDNSSTNTTTGSGFVDGTLGANVITAAGGIRGGNTSATSNLVVLSNTTFIGNIVSNNQVTLSNTLTVVGTSTLSSNLAVSGNTNISNTLTISGNTVVSEILSVTGNTNLSSTLIVGGRSTFSGNTNVTNTLIVSGNTTINGVVSINNNLTTSGNVTFSTGAIIANGSLGANATILTSNGTAMYWGSIAATGGTVTSIEAANGLNGGTITSSGAISVRASSGLVSNTSGLFVQSNSGIIANTTGVHINSNNGLVSNTSGLFVQPGTGAVVNATGVHVNSTYIGTIASNSATFANQSVTNTFTIGTSAYFVSNGNLGIGVASPTYKLDLFNPGTNTTVASIRNDVVGLVSFVGPSSGVIGLSTNHPLLVVTNNLERIRVDSSGNVGIGNSTPVEKFKVAGAVADNYGDVRSVPLNSKAATYTLVANDTGLCVATTANVTVNGHVLSTGFVTSIYNNSSANVTIISGTDATIYLAGTATTGNRTLAQRGLSTILMVGANTFVISGTGLT